MKKIKLNYVAFLLLSATALSCATEDLGIEEVDTEQLSDKDYIDPEISTYLIDGVEAKDNQSVINASSKAWNIFYDYPNKTAIISTTQNEFEKLKSSNLEFKQSFEQQPEIFKEEDFDVKEEDVLNFSDDNELFLKENDGNNSESESISNRIKGRFIPYKSFNILAHASENDRHDIVLHGTYSSGHSSGALSYSNADLRTTTDCTKYVSYLSRSPRNNYKFNTVKAPLQNLLNASFKKVIVNHHNKVRRTIIFYRDKNYKGPSRGLAFGPNGHVRLTNQAIFGSKGAQSMKIVSK